MKCLNKSFVAFLLAAVLTVPVCTYAFSQSDMAYRDSGSSSSNSTSSDDSSSGVGTFDNTPPVLHSVRISTTEATAPGKLSVTVHASDDVSGIRHISVGFRNLKNDRYISSNLDIGYDNINLDQTFTGEVKISKYEQSGLFKLSHITLDDDARNSVFYRLKDEMGKHDKLLPYELSFKVKNSAYPETDEPSNSSEASSDYSSESGTSPRAEYWNNITDRIDAESHNMNMQVNAGDNIPAGIFEAIYRKDITITISQEGKDDIIVNGKTMPPIEANRTYYPIEDLRELYNAEQAAHDLAILYMSQQNITKDQYVKYYLENYNNLYNRFYKELEQG